MWEDILSIANMMNAPRLLAEDFNDIACADEKKGGASVCTYAEVQKVSTTN
jgi:hypothetical protein